MPARWTRWVRLFVFGAALVDCGTSATPPADDAATDTTADDAAIALDDAPTSTCPGVCPETPPTGGACTRGTVCTYGTDPRLDCRTTVECDADHWVTRTVPPFCSDPPSASVCPTNPGDVDAGCVPGSLCNVDGGLCGCTPSGTWLCNTCTHSNLGAVCTPNERFCGGVACGSIECMCGRWVAVIHTCP